MYTTLDLTVPGSRPRSVMSPLIDRICTEMRAAGREDLVHYAGASYRDLTAWWVCRAWSQDRDASEAVLKERVLAFLGESERAARDLAPVGGVL